MVMHKIKTRTLIQGSCITTSHVILIENVLNNIVLKKLRLQIRYVFKGQISALTGPVGIQRCHMTVKK